MGKQAIIYKQIVEDFLHFLNTHKGYIVTDSSMEANINASHYITMGRI